MATAYHLYGQSDSPSVELSNFHGLTLAHLPPEILGMILTKLDWEDILRARQTCWTLHSASRTWQVWYSIFRFIASDRDHPLPFANHVPTMSAAELESAVTHWLRVEAGWLSKTKNPRRRTVGVCDENWFHLVEGGRWLIASSLRHGCASAYDLDGIKAQKYIIIRPEDRLEQYEVSSMLVQVYTILPHFDLQIALVHDTQSLNPSRLSIWRVGGTQHENHHPFTSALISSFNTHLDGFTAHSALHGDLIAQELCTVDSVVIVIHDWRRSSSFLHHKWCIFPANRYNALKFLPDRRLLTANEDRACIYAIPAEFSPDQPTNPTLTFTVSFGARFFRGLSPTYHDHAGNTRIMLGTRGGICQLIIPPRNQPSTSMLVTVPTNRCHYFALGTHRALITIGLDDMQALTVSFCQAGPILSEIRPWPIKKAIDYRPLIDEITGRVVEITRSGQIVTFDYSA